MGLFSLFRKNKQESASGQGKFLSRAAGESAATRSRSTNSRKSSKTGKDESADPVLPEKKRARRRLIGAVALVLAVVILLPMVLDSEPRPLTGDIAIQIPSKDGKGTGTAAASADDKAGKPVAEPKEEIVDPATLAPVNDNPTVASGAAAVPSAPASAMATSPAVPAAVEKAESPKVPAKPDVVEEKVLKPEPKTEQKAEPRAEPKAAVKPQEHKEERKKDSVKDVVKQSEKVSKDSDSARAMAILEGKSAAGSKFVIQVAALATQEKIDELRGKLSDAGIQSFTQKVATKAGDRTRIRVGPFGSRDEAEKARIRINRLGLNATIVPV
jgi:DedD protein